MTKDPEIPIILPFADDEESGGSEETHFNAEALDVPSFLDDAKTAPHLLVTCGAKAAGTLCRARDGMIVGRANAADLVLDSISVSRRHALLRITSSGDVKVEDLGSRNGLFYNGERVTSCVLQEGRPLRIGEAKIILVRLEDDEPVILKNLLDSATVDPTTRLLTAPALHSVMSQRFMFGARNQTPVSFVVMSIDQLAAVREKHGTPAGAAVLRHVGGRIRRTMRGNEEASLGRHGADSIGFLLPLNVDIAHRCAERCRESLEQGQMTIGGVPIALTLSAGVASNTDPSCISLRDLIVNAERAAQAASAQGGNRTLRTAE
jgi:diguanylate cyclase (GGDEF)-like protein